MKISNIIKDKQLLKKIFPYDKNFYTSIDPINNQIIKQYDTDSSLLIQNKVKNSHFKFLDWRKKSIGYRLILMQNLAHNLNQNVKDLSETISKEMVKYII